MQAILIGVRRQGKSTLSLYLARKCANEGAGNGGVIIFDPNNQFRTIHAVYTTEDLQWELEKNEIREVRFLPDTDNIRASFDAFANVVWNTIGGTYSLIIDEADELQSPNTIEPMYARFVRRAPTEIDAPNTVHLFSATHQIADFNRIVKALASDWYMFRTILARQLDAIAEQWGEEIAEHVSQLPPYTFVHAWLGEGGERKFEIISDPASWYVPLLPQEPRKEEQLNVRS